MTARTYCGALLRTRLVVVGLFASGLLSLPAGGRPAEANQAAPGIAQAGRVDPRWAAWLGCWRLAGEGDTAARHPVTDLTVCVSPAAGSDGVTLRTLMGGRSLLERQVVADGTRRDVVDRDCRGAESSDWSSSGLRLFTRAEVVCADQAPRTVSGFATMTSGDTWLDIQVIGTGTGDRIRIRRYERVAVRPGPGEPARAGSARVATPLTIDDVKEASARLSPRAVEAALLEADASFDLKARHLIDLDAAGVPTGIIDLMVALSFPQRFTVQSTAPVRASSWTDLAGLSILISPTVVTRYLAASVYPPFDYFAWADEEDYWGTEVVVVHPQPTGPRALLVDGLGYTQISRREPADAEGAPGDQPSSSPADSSGSVSPEGYSRGTTGGDTGRTAEPRPPPEALR